MTKQLRTQRLRAGEKDSNVGEALNEIRPGNQSM
jgi:hypothetical protein